ncbi:TPA: transcriptional regulator [Klebsiella pneumoniae]|nr:transcriptional regulator [Klebsiella pneumoniae]HBV3677843.1 transcriptional regulator [Klebsiella pneumoniae]HBW7960827.1 transcriptional regulator [Klebsiella pneumoniae]HBW8057369.1 transcriptional regulator [Klebsiella pneumoniae]HBW8663427.1 transcriptional regulator [Klebsiella pneumoniae]
MPLHCHFDNTHCHIDYFNHCHFDNNQNQKKLKTDNYQLIKKLARNMI